MERINIKFAKTKKNAIIPSKRLEDAGYDIYACFDEDYIIIMPHETKMIPSGIASVIPEDYVFILEERSSTGTKGISQRCGVIDSGYRGSWGIPLTNTNDIPVIISKIKDKEEIAEEILGTDKFILYPYEKAISQAILLPVPRTNIEEISYEELQTYKSERGIGRLGSSGK